MISEHEGRKAEIVINEIPDLGLLRRCWAFRKNVEAIDMELEDLKTRQLFPKEYQEHLRKQLRQERNRYAAEWNRIIAYIDSIEPEELRKTFIYRFIKRMDYREIHRKLYGFSDLNAGSLIRKRIERYVKAHPIGEPERIQTQPQQKE
mgnify:FL=1